MKTPRITTVEAFLLSGLAIVAVFWAAEFTVALAELGEPTHPAGEAGTHAAVGTLVTRLEVVFFALGFSLIGLVYEHHGRLMKEPAFALRHAAAYLLLVDATLHAFALNDHIAHAFSVGFFAVVALAQFAAGIALPRMGARLDAAVLGLTLFLIAAYAATRTFVVWPLEAVETFEPLGILSKLVELVLVLVIVPMHRLDRLGTAAGGAGPGPGTHPG